MRDVCFVLVFPLSVAWSFASAQDSARVVYSESPAVWFEAHRVGAVISPDGRLAAMPIRWPESLRLVDLQRGVAVPMMPLRGVDSVRAAVFTASGGAVVRGWRMGEWGWFMRGADDGVVRVEIPADAEPRWSPDGSIAYTRRRPYFGRPLPDSIVHVQIGDRSRALALPGRVTGIAWHPGRGGQTLLVLASDARGVSTLYRVDASSGRIDVAAGDLDADPQWSPIAIRGDGRRAYVALAGPTAALPAQRHEASADRDLDIYEIDLASGARRAVVATSAEEYAPAVASDQLYWTRTEAARSVAIGPSSGGPLRDVLSGVMLPSWRPDGRALGFTYGDFRAADWVLNWEGGFVEIDHAGTPSGRMQPLITGPHEDFGPVWSPSGRWIAYHSHRSSTPTVHYAGPGTTDDIWIRRADAPAAEAPVEIRLTSGEREVGPPEWSRDGTRILFTAADHGGHRRSHAGIIAIDTMTGRATSHTRLSLGPIPGAEKVAWSPVSDEIAVQAIESPGRHAIWIVRADGTRPRRLVRFESHTYSGVDWTADGKSIIYSAIVDGRMQLFAIPTGGGKPTQLTRDERNVLHPAVSPDGRFVAVTRILHEKAIFRMRLDSDTMTSARERDLRAIDSARRRFEAAIRTDDAPAIARAYAPDAFYFPPRRPPLAGDAIRRAIGATRDFEISHVVHEVDLRGDIAYEIGRWIQRARNGGATIGGGGYLWIWKRQPDGTWAIWREVWNDGPPGDSR